MSQADFWYIRFPDGRVLRAASTVMLRQELNSGHVPLGSTVRRSPYDEWVALAWTQEFADLVEELAARPPSEGRQPPESSRARGPDAPRAVNAAAEHPATVGSRMDPSRLHLIGIRGYRDELLAALDSALVLKKILLGAAAGLLLGILLLVLKHTTLSGTGGDSRGLAVAWLSLAMGVIVVTALTGLLARLTYIELDRLRPARWREGLNGLGRLTVWVTVSQVLVWGTVWITIVLLRWLPFWLGAGSEPRAGVVLALGMVGETLLWLVLLCWWLVPPLLVVEACTVWTGLRLWLALLRRHLGRALLYQTMTIGLGVLITAPFLLPIAPLFPPLFSPPASLHEAAGAVRYLLLGMACAPMLSYWITSNVFIYLNLRYGTSSRR